MAPAPSLFCPCTSCALPDPCVCVLSDARSWLQSHRAGASNALEVSRTLPAVAGDSKGSSFNDSSVSQAFSQFQNHLFHAPASDGGSPTHPRSPSTPTDPPRDTSKSPGSTASPAADLSASAAAAAEASRQTLARCLAASGVAEDSGALSAANPAAHSAAFGAHSAAIGANSAAIGAHSAAIGSGGSRGFLGPGASGGSRAVGATGECGHDVRVRPAADTSVDMRSRKRYILHQLDAFGAGAGVLGEYYMADASSANRFVGGAAMRTP